MGPLAEITAPLPGPPVLVVAGGRKLYCFKKKSGENSNIDLCGYPGWEKCYLKYLYKRSAPVADGPQRSLAEVQKSVYEIIGMIRVWPHQRRGRKKYRFSPFGFRGRWEIRKIGASGMGGTEEGEDGFLEPLWGGGGKSRVSKSDFSLLTNVFFFLLEKYHLHNLS